MRNMVLFLKSNISRNILSLGIAVFGGILICWSIIALGNQVGDYGNMVVGMIDADQSSISVDFKHYVSQELNIDIVEDSSYEELINQLLDKRISVIIEIPKDYEQNAINRKAAGQLEMTALDDYENIAFIKSYMNSYFAGIDMMLQSADSDAEVFDTLFKNYQTQELDIVQISAKTVDVESEKVKQGFIYSLGFFIMLASSCGLFVAFIVFDDRKNGVFRRIQATPVKPVQYIIGTSVFGVIVGWMMVGIICGFLTIWNISTGIPMGIMLYMMMAFIVINVLVSLFIGLCFDNKGGVAMAIAIFSCMFSLLGGAYFPIDVAPSTLQNIAKLTPQYWLIQGFKDIQADPQADIRANMIVLALFILLFALMSGVRFVQRTASRN